MHTSHATFPETRLRRSRQSAFARQLSQEHELSVHDLIWPLFIHEGQSDVAIEAMPGVFRHGYEGILAQAARAVDLGIPAIALFPAIEASKKCPKGAYALDPNGLVPKTIQAIKSRFPALGIVADVALDPYTSHGQDGLVDETGSILNDATLTQLNAQALVLAQSGADVIAPSDMMDGRVGTIRNTLESHQLHHTLILSYAAKYASHYYGPFREAVGSKGALNKGDKKTYQMNPANSQEALREVAMDLNEGADWVMVKPGLPYLDVIKLVKTTFQVPTFAYQVSGEYALLKHGITQGLVQPNVLFETMMCFKRAGTDGILSYFAAELAEQLNR